MESLTVIKHYIFMSLFLCIFVVDADPEFCTRGFKMASRFYKCWSQATFANKYPPLYEPHPYLDSQFLNAYATHMCSVVKPDALKCLREDIKECTNIDKLMGIADRSGGACLGNGLNPFFKTHVIDRLVPIEGDSPCFELADRTYDCYQAAGQKVMQMGGQSDDIVTFHRVADKLFNAYWECMVVIYKSNEKICPHWQIPMLLTLQRTAMPSLFGLQLKPEQVALLELGPVEQGENETEVLNPGPSKLYLLLQLRETRPDVGDDEDSLILELSDLNNDPHMTMEQEDQDDQLQKIVDPRSLSLKELKKLLKEQRRSYNEVKDFIRQAKNGQESSRNDKKTSREEKVDQKQNDGRRRSRLNLDRMVA